MRTPSATPTLKLWPIRGTNVYQAMPTPALKAQLAHSENDPDYPEHIYRALEKQRQPIKESGGQVSTVTTLTTFNTSLVTSRSSSDTSSPSSSKPIPNRGSNVISLF